MKNIGDYESKTFPLSRLSTFDVVAVGLEKHHVKALIELDVTKARKKISDLKKQKVKVSFTAWLLKCISETARYYKENVIEVHCQESLFNKTNDGNCGYNSHRYGR